MAPMIATKMTAVTTENPDRLQAAIDTISLGRLGLPEGMLIGPSGAAFRLSQGFDTSLQQSMQALRAWLAARSGSWTPTTWPAPWQKTWAAVT